MCVGLFVWFFVIFLKRELDGNIFWNTVRRQKYLDLHKREKNKKPSGKQMRISYLWTRKFTLPIRGMGDKWDRFLIDRKPIPRFHATIPRRWNIQMNDCWCTVAMVQSVAMLQSSKKPNITQLIIIKLHCGLRVGSWSDVKRRSLKEHEIFWWSFEIFLPKSLRFLSIQSSSQNMHQHDY